MNDSRTSTEPQEKSHLRWTPPAGTLGELVRAMSVRAPAISGNPENSGASEPPSFADALRGGFVSVIAELKRSSPSKGAINPTLDAAEQAVRFEKGNAKAISVLTEPERFGGSLEDIGIVRRACSLPVLKKDFHLTPQHILEAKALGASAALLIVRAVPPSVVGECIASAKELGIDLLVEVHHLGELELAIDAGAQIIGVNARNLETLELHSSVHGEILPRIPQGIIAVAESGMSTAADVERAAAAGADAVLIGSSLSRAADVTGLLHTLATVERRRDVRTD